MSRGAILLTGATGFLGMEVLARLLEHDDREVLALVRAPDDQGAPRSASTACWHRLWRDRGPPAYRERVRAVPADLTRPGLGLSSAGRAMLADRAGTVLHCAASISFDLPLDEARRINVEGTREVIGFAREARERGLARALRARLDRVRQSAVIRGLFRERQLDVGQAFRNTYEQTK